MQLIAFKQMVPVLDKNLGIILIGDRVRVKRCVGRYGQTVVEEGTVIEQYGNNPRHCLYGQFQYRKDNGEIQTADIDYHYDKHAGVCFRRHEDFEHGHERWAEVISRDE